MQNYTFPSSERLKSRKIIASLFQKGSNSFNVYPVRFVWHFPDTAVEPFQVAFSVSKRTFKHAHDRNLVKRRMREAFRLHKHTFTDKYQGENIALMFIFNGKEIMSYQEIERSFSIGFSRLSNNFNK